MSLSTFWFGSYQNLNFCSWMCSLWHTLTPAAAPDFHSWGTTVPFFLVCLLSNFGSCWISAVDADTNVAAGPLWCAEWATAVTGYESALWTLLVWQQKFSLNQRCTCWFSKRVFLQQHCLFMFGQYNQRISCKDRVRWCFHHLSLNSLVF